MSEQLYYIFVEIKNGRYYRAFIPPKPFEEAQWEATKFNKQGYSTVITCNPEMAFYNPVGHNNTYFLGTPGRWDGG